MRTVILSVILGPLVGRDGTAAEKSFYDNFNSSKDLSTAINWMFRQGEPPCW